MNLLLRAIPVAAVALSFVLPLRAADALALEPCRPAGVEEDLLCGRLRVPENPAEPAGRQITLSIVVVPAIDPHEDAVPLFDLAGGPGLATTPGASFYATVGSAYRQHRPVVLVDRRGTGESNPLRCPELERRGRLEEMYPAHLVRACRERLEADNDVTMYGSLIAASDLDAVREALGAPRVDLFGISYGTILAQVYMREYPARVRSAVLVGAAPIDFKTPLYHAAAAQRALDLVFYECQMDSECAGAYPELRREWSSVLSRLEAGPVRVELAAVDGETASAVTIAREHFGEAFRGLLAVAATQRQIPYIIHRAATGDFAPFVSALGRDSSAFSLGLYLSVACTEGTTTIRPETIGPATAGTFLGDARVSAERSACVEWKAEPVSADLLEQGNPTVPVLVISGGMDHVTPPRFAEQVCAGMANCRLVSIPQLAHAPFDLGMWRNGDCLDRLALAFLENPEPRALDTSCVGAMAPPPFRLPETQKTTARADAADR